MARSSWISWSTVWAASVLATLILTLTATAILVRTASSITLRRSVDRWTVTSDDLLKAAEAPIQDWLATKAHMVVLPPEAITPRIEVLHDRWTFDGVEYQLQVTVWDQFGMVDITAIQAGSPLRTTVPPEVLRQVDAAEHASTIQGDKPGQMFGLDLFVDSSDLDQSPYPTAAASSAISFGHTAETVAPEGGRTEPSSDALLTEGAPGGGGYVSTRNGKPLLINVNTAPIELVAASLRLAGRGGLEQLIAARAKGHMANVAGSITTAAPESQFAPQFVNSSGVWAFRIDIRVNQVRRSWWAMYLKTDQPQWECVQRLAITH